MESRRRSEHMKVIGITGGTGSGKTTFCNELAETLGARARTLTQDRYYYDLDWHSDDDVLGHNFDHPDALDFELMEQHLQQLVRGETAAIPVYDLVTHRRTEETEPLEPAEFLLVEGILIGARPSLRVLFEPFIYVATPPDVRLSRRIRRDLEERGRSVDLVLHQWHHHVRPMHERYVAPAREASSLVISGLEPPAENVQRVLSVLNDGAVDPSSETTDGSL